VEIASGKLVAWRTDPGSRNPAGDAVPVRATARDAVRATEAAARARASSTATKTRAAKSTVAAQPAGTDGNGVCPPNAEGIAACVRSNVDVQVPLALLKAQAGGKIRFRVSLWRDKLPVDALPLEGSI